MINKLSEQVSVVVCCRNSDAYIDSCLASIAKQSPKEIIIVDGMSTDNTLIIARKYTNAIYSDEGKGLGWARKLGVSRSSCPYIVIVSPDDVISSDFLSQAVKEIQSDSTLAALLAPKKMAAINSFWDHGQNSIYELVKTFPLRVVGNPSVYRSLALKEFPYDDTFSANEDTDLCERWHRAGLKVGWGKEFYTSEIESRNFSGFRNRYIWYGQGDFRFVKKWLDIDYEVGKRHLLHPLKNYIIKYPICLIKQRDYKAALFSALCGVFRYYGFLGEMVRYILKVK